jgi:predicted transcriptional regulator
MLATLPLGLASMLISPSASAQQVRGDQMTRLMEEYFEGERSAGYVFFGQGLVSIGTSAFLFTRNDDMSRGAAYPVVVVGALEATVGLALMLRTSKQIAERRKQIATEPATFRRDEQKRMTRVIRQFVFLEVFELAAIATGLGLATAGELNHKPLLTGVGAGLTVQGAAILGLDFLAERRGQRYLNAIVDFNPTVSRDGFGLTLRGVF